MRSKTRLIAAVASLLVCLAMVGTGFASWVILQDVKKEATGNVKAEAVTDGEITFEVEPTQDISIVFGGPATQNSTVWIYSDGSSGTEKLSVDFTLKVTGTVGSIDMSIAATGVASAIGSGYIGEPEWSLGTVTNTSSNTDVKTASNATLKENKLSFGADGKGYPFDQGVIKVTLTYKWGAAFGTKNPYEFFNGKTRTEKVGTDSDYESSLKTYYQSYENQTWEEAAKAVLGDLYSDLGETSGDTITITFIAHQAQPSA